MKSKNLIILGLFLLCNMAIAEIITVSLVGGDYETIHEAVIAANDGDTVMVLSGNYIFTAEQGVVTIDKELAMIGGGYDAIADGGTTIYSPGQIFIFAAGSDESRLEGFRLQGYGNPMVDVTTPDIIIEENLFQNRFSSGWSLQVTGSQDTVRNNIFTHGDATGNTYGIGISSTTDAMINNNLFASMSWGVTTTTNSNLKIANNVFVNVSTYGVANGNYVWNGTDNSNVHGNIFMNCGTAVYNRAGTPTVSYNGFYNNTSNSNTTNLEAVTVDPLFVDYGSNDVYDFESYDDDSFDFHLQSSSTYIDAGPPQEEWYDLEPGEGGLRNDLGMYGYGWPIGENGAPTIPVVNTINVSPSTVSPSGTITIEATGRIGD